MSVFKKYFNYIKRKVSTRIFGPDLIPIYNIRGPKVDRSFF